MQPVGWFQEVEKQDLVSTRTEAMATVDREALNENVVQKGWQSLWKRPDERQLHDKRVR